MTTVFVFLLDIHFYLLSHRSAFSAHSQSQTCALDNLRSRGTTLNVQNNMGIYKEYCVRIFRKPSLGIMGLFRDRNTKTSAEW